MEKLATGCDKGGVGIRALNQNHYPSDVFSLRRSLSSVNGSFARKVEPKTVPLARSVLSLQNVTGFLALSLSLLSAAFMSDNIPGALSAHPLFREDFGDFEDLVIFI